MNTKEKDVLGVIRMALNKSKLLIRDYENIRDILRDIYTYGCYSREDFVDKGISGRKYDNEQRRIHAYLPEHFIQKRRENKKVIQYCKYNMMDSANNYLAETFRNKSFTALDILSHFFVMQLLNQNEKLTLSELLNQMPVNQEVVFTKDNLRIKLEEMQHNGLIKSEKHGGRVFYSLVEDLWKDFSVEELLEIYSLLEFMKNVHPLEMPYYFLQRRLKLYLLCEREVVLKQDETMLFRHNHFLNSLDNDILLEIMSAIYAHQKVIVSTRNKEELLKFEVIPIKVVHDSIYARQYLVSYNVSEQDVSVFRLDRIESVKIGNLADEELCQKALEACDREQACWSISGMEKELTEVKVEFVFDEEREPYILKRIQQEGHGGVVERLDKGRYLYGISVRDPKEMIPWIRSFGERAKVLSSGTFEIESLIAEEFKKAVEKYEAFS